MKVPLICALLALLPLSSIRMVCITSHDLAARTTAAAATADQQADECARVCHRRPAAASPRPAPVVRCLLVADPTCEFLAGSGIAVVPSSPALSPQRVAVAIPAPLPDGYQPPALTRHSPPPRSAA